MVKIAKGLRRVTVGLGIAIVALFGMVSMASANAAFDNACEGTLDGSGSGKTCTVVVEGGDADIETQPAGQSGNAWTATVTTSDTVTVDTWYNQGPDGVTSNTTGGDTEVTKCTNPGGREMSLDHQRCQLP